MQYHIAKVAFCKLHLVKERNLFLFRHFPHTPAGPATSWLVPTNQSVPNTLNNGCLRTQLLAFLFQRAQVILSIAASAIRVKNHFMYTMLVRPEQIAVPPATPPTASSELLRWLFPGELPAPGVRRIRRVWASSSPFALEAPISEPSAVIWGMFSAHFMDIYVPGLWHLRYF